MPPHTTITSLGATKATSIAYDSTKAAIAIPQLTTADTFATLNAAQTLTNKTLTEPIIESIKTSSTGGTITLPTVASGSSAALATTADVASAVPTNMVTTDTTQNNISGAKTFTTETTFNRGLHASIFNGERYEKGLGLTQDGGGGMYFYEYFPVGGNDDGDEKDITVLHVPNLINDAPDDYIATTELAQTLNNKTLTTPIIASLKQSSTGGTINMPTVASGSSATLATTDDLPDTTGMVTADGNQTLSNKTLTTPIISSLKQDSNGGTINMPTVESGDTATLATLETDQDISGQKTFTSGTSFNNGISVIAGVNSSIPRTFSVRVNEGVANISFVRVVDRTPHRLLIPDHTATTDYVATTELAQTLSNKTLTTPIIASLQQSSTGGTINVPAVASGETATLALASELPDTTYMVSTNGTQTITGQKTLTSPVLTDGTHTISMPASAALTANTTFATALDIASLQSTVASATDFNTLKTILSNLLTYLKNWASVGNLNMDDIITESDSANYLGLTPTTP